MQVPLARAYACGYPAAAPPSLARAVAADEADLMPRQADVELDTGQRCRRQGLDPGRQRGARHRDRVDVIGLPTLTARTSTGRHQPRRDAHNAFTATEQEAL